MQPASENAAWCQVLGVTPQATQDEIRQAYLNLVNVWHPDRFVAPHLKALAEEKLKEIINAYDSLEAARGSKSDGPSDTPPPEPAIQPGRASSKWTPLAVMLATVLAMGGVFYLVGGGSRDHSRPIQTSPAEDISAPPKVRSASPKPRPISQLAEAPTQPETGFLERAKPPFGDRRLTVSNDTHLDAYSRLIMKTRVQKQLVTIYIRSGESFTVTRIPVGEYMLHTEAGQGWLPAAGTFATDRQQLDPVGPLTYLQVQASSGVQSDEYTIELSAGPSKTVLRLPSFLGGETK